LRKRIDAMEAGRIEGLVTEKIKSQSPSPETEPALRRLIEGIRTGKPNYEEMVPRFAEATREQLSELQPDISDAGSIASIHFVGVGGGGADVYFVQHEHLARYWRIALDSHGLISMAWVSPGL
jgi:hypothetical protein